MVKRWLQKLRLEAEHVVICLRFLKFPWINLIFQSISDLIPSCPQIHASPPHLDLEVHTASSPQNGRSTSPNLYLNARATWAATPCFWLSISLNAAGPFRTMLPSIVSWLKSASSLYIRFIFVSIDKIAPSKNRSIIPQRRDLDLSNLL